MYSLYVMTLNYVINISGCATWPQSHSPSPCVSFCTQILQTPEISEAGNSLGHDDVMPIVGGVGLPEDERLIGQCPHSEHIALQKDIEENG